MATPLGDNEIQLQLEAYGEKVAKVTSKNRDILIKKLNHYKVRNAIQKTNGKASGSLSRGWAKNGAEPSNGNGKDDSDEDVQRTDSRRRTRQRIANKSYGSPNETQLSVADSFTDENRVSLGIQTSLNSTAFSQNENQSYLNPDEESLFDNSPNANAKKSTAFDSSDSESELILPAYSNVNVRRYPSLRQFSNFSSRNENGNGNSAGLSLRYSALQRNVGFRTRVWDLIKRGHCFVTNYFKSDKGRNKPVGRRYGVDRQISNQHISSVLLGIFALFFIVVAVIYFEQSSYDVTKAAVRSDDWMICPSTSTIAQVEGCNSAEEIAVLQELVGQLKAILTKHTDTCSCFEESSMNLGDLSQRISLSSFASSDSVEQSKMVAKALQLINRNPQWDLLTLSGDGAVTQVSTDVASVQKVATWRQWWCWAVVIATSSFRYVAVVCLVAAAAFLITLYSRTVQRRREAEVQEMYSFVEKIIDVLEKNHAAHSLQTSVTPSVAVLHPPYLAINHVRDELIPLKERRCKQKVWDKAVDFLAANESRIRIESQHISGELFDVFRWLPPPTVNPGRIWQGQAFSAQRMPKASFVEFCTPCLKIRNMFDLDVEYGDNWHVRVEDAVLEKCGPDSGIVHVAVDRKAKEGCVYVKCLSREHAANNYSSLHGWWYDGNLVTVKFLRLERYHERFPHAQSATAQLIPSNDQKLSLAKPYHRSCIEVT